MLNKWISHACSEYWNVYHHKYVKCAICKWTAKSKYVIHAVISWLRDSIKMSKLNEFQRVEKVGKGTECARKGDSHTETVITIESSKLPTLSIQCACMKSAKWKKKTTPNRVRFFCAFIFPLGPFTCYLAVLRPRTISAMMCGET